jgi:hypothetical protein
MLYIKFFLQIQLKVSQGNSGLELSLSAGTELGNQLGCDNDAPQTFGLNHTPWSPQ